MERSLIQGKGFPKICAVSISIFLFEGRGHFEAFHTNKRASVSDMKTKFNSSKCHSSCGILGTLQFHTYMKPVLQKG